MKLLHLALLAVSLFASFHVLPASLASSSKFS
jgi:hypothetical protein